MKSCFKKLFWLIIAFFLISATSITMAQKVFMTSINGLIGENKIWFGEKKYDLLKLSRDSSFIVRVRDPRIFSFNNDKLNEQTVYVKDGKFKIELLLNSPVYLSFEQNLFTDLKPLPFKSYGIYEMFIEPGDQLTIDYRKGDQYYRNNVILGRGAEKFKCLREITDKLSREKSPQEFFENQTKGRFETEDKFLKIAFDIIEVYKSRLTPLSYKVLKADLQNAIINASCESFVGHRSKDAEVRKQYYSRMKTQKTVIDLLDPAANISRDYLGFVQNKLLIRYMEKNKIEFPGDITTAQRYWLYMDSLPMPIRDRAVAILLMTEMVAGDIAKSKKLIEQYLKDGNPKDKNYQTIKKYFEQKVKIIKGSAAFPFALKDTSGRIVKMEDFRGKVIMIDFMFTSCPGCVSLTPILTKLEESFSGKEIVFLSISVEKDLKDVKLGIGRSAVASSLQLYTNGEGSSHPIINHYMIGSYPQLLVIDREGKLVTTNAPDPREDGGKSLSELLEGTLIKTNK